METIRRTILLESLRSRKAGLTYGTITADTIYVNVFLTQNCDDMGLFTDYSGEIDNDSYKVEDYFSTQHDMITATTDSRLIELKTYSRTNPYNTGVTNNTMVYVDYEGNTINGISKVISMSDSEKKYVFDTNDDIHAGKETQTTGQLYIDYSDMTVVKYEAKGWNATNTSISHLIEEEILFGITSPPTVESDVFIDRGTTSPLEPHLRLSEIESLEHLELYGNGYFKLNR